MRMIDRVDPRLKLIWCLVLLFTALLAHHILTEGLYPGFEKVQSSYCDFSYRRFADLCDAASLWQGRGTDLEMVDHFGVQRLHSCGNLRDFAYRGGFLRSHSNDLLDLCGRCCFDAAELACTLSLCYVGFHGPTVFSIIKRRIPIHCSKSGRKRRCHRYGMAKDQGAADDLFALSLSGHSSYL